MWNPVTETRMLITARPFWDLSTIRSYLLAPYAGMTLTSEEESWTLSLDFISLAGVGYYRIEFLAFILSNSEIPQTFYGACTPPQQLAWFAPAIPLPCVYIVTKSATGTFWVIKWPVLVGRRMGLCQRHMSRTVWPRRVSGFWNNGWVNDGGWSGWLNESRRLSRKVLKGGSRQQIPVPWSAVVCAKSACFVPSRPISINYNARLLPAILCGYQPFFVMKVPSAVHRERYVDSIGFRVGPFVKEICLLLSACTWFYPGEDKLGVDLRKG